MGAELFVQIFSVLRYVASKLIIIRNSFPTQHTLFTLCGHSSSEKCIKNTYRGRQAQEDIGRHTEGPTRGVHYVAPPEIRLLCAQS